MNELDKKKLPTNFFQFAKLYSLRYSWMILQFQLSNVCSLHHFEWWFSKCYSHHEILQPKRPSEFHTWSLHLSLLLEFRTMVVGVGSRLVQWLEKLNLNHWARWKIVFNHYFLSLLSCKVRTHSRCWIPNILSSGECFLSFKFELQRLNENLPSVSTTIWLKNGIRTVWHKNKIKSSKVLQFIKPWPILWSINIKPSSVTVISLTSVWYSFSLMRAKLVNSSYFTRLTQWWKLFVQFVAHSRRLRSNWSNCIW